MSKCEEVKKILNTVATQAVMICPDIPNEDYYAHQICQLFPKSSDNPGGCEPTPEQTKVERIFREIEEHSACERLPFRDGKPIIRTIPEDAYQSIKKRGMK